LVIFDEAHRMKNHKSITSKLLNSITKNKNKILLLSATITDKINCFKPFGVAFGFYDDPNRFKVWMKRQMTVGEKKYKEFFKNKKFNNLDEEVEAIQLKIIHDNIFPGKGSRLKICELG